MGLVGDDQILFFVGEMREILIQKQKNQTENHDPLKSTDLVTLMF
jgi:hypothetical protein